MNKKISFFGDSWTNGYGIHREYSFPSLIGKYLNSNIDIICRDGSDNFQIYEKVVKYIEEEITDLIIIGWTGISRYPDTINEKQFSLSLVYDEETDVRREFFNEYDLLYLQKKWRELIDKINLKCEKKDINVIHFSVFGDNPDKQVDNFIDISFLEYIGIDQRGYKFEYDTQIFEFDFLHKKNKVAEKFCDNYLSSDWKLALMEREELRMHQPRKNFQSCGHPTENGHKIWSEFLIKKILEKSEFMNAKQ